MASPVLNARDSAPRTAATAYAASPPVALFLKLEALLVLAIALAAYSYLGFSWWLFAALILAPDLSAIGCAGGSRLGAWTYDLAHTYVVPAALAAIGYATREPLLMAISAIWASHIGGDRLVGYGLKFSGNPQGHAPVAPELAGKLTAAETDPARGAPKRRSSAPAPLLKYRDWQRSGHCR